MALGVALPFALPAQGPAGRLSGVVRDTETSAPVAGATVLVLGTPLAAESDSAGRFTLSMVPTGTRIVVSRKIGYSPAMVTLRLSEGDSAAVFLYMRQAPQMLPTASVVEAERLLEPFRERRRFGHGAFMDYDEVQRAPGSRMSEKLRSLPGLQIIYSRTRSNSVTIASTRGPDGMRNGVCYSATMINGVQVFDMSVNDIQPNTVAAIEWYAGPAQIPAQFNGKPGTNCGLLIIWLR
ncbi:MAG: carboxypeptidase regulatory-like domain-containing protein [Gemmatimonadota bacterium]|nr:carboxypeptidase regulatory-like domain-containing protein [Gemmatimonadota bacterium]